MINALKGALIALVTSLIIAILLAYIFRVPIPLWGMIGPFGGINPYSMGIRDVLTSVLGAWVFYGIFGGFIILPLGGAIAGALTGRKYLAATKKNRMILLWSSVAGAIPVLALSTLDYVIGPW